MSLKKLEENTNNILIEYKKPSTIPTGYVYAPYITRTVSTSVNNEMVWHRSRWIRFFLWFKLSYKKLINWNRYYPFEKEFLKKEINSKYYAKNLGN